MHLKNLEEQVEHCVADLALLCCIFIQYLVLRAAFKPTRQTALPKPQPGHFAKSRTVRAFSD